MLYLLIFAFCVLVFVILFVGFILGEKSNRPDRDSYDRQRWYNNEDREDME